MPPLNLVLVSCDPPLHSQVLLGSLQLPVDEVLVMFLAGLNILLFLPLSVLVDPAGSLLVSPSCSPPRKPSSPSNSPPRKKAGLDLGRNYRKKSPVNIRGKSPKKISKVAPEKKAALTDAEKQAKLAEMMSNATWRDQQRTSRVNKYREGQEKEDIEASKEHDKNFINRELKRAQENLTVEGRITANKYKIQRGHGDMDKNFARR
jgi:hypothetical protein